MKQTTKQLILVFAGIGLVLSAVAQNFAIDWFKIAGGGGISTNGQFSVNGTVGQPDASGPSTGGSFSVTGGFWALYAVQTAGAPLLSITLAGNHAIVSWPVSATGWTLQTNSNIGTTNWVNYGGTVISNRVTNSVISGSLFFRLVHP